MAEMTLVQATVNTRCRISDGGTRMESGDEINASSGKSWITVMLECD